MPAALSQIPDYLTYPAILLTAFIAAIINSMAGGGTFLTFPALTGLAKLSEKVANMTSTVGLWPGSVSSIYAARDEFKTIPKNMLLTFGFLSLIGGLLGSLLLIFTSETTFKLVIPWLLIFATLIFGCSKKISAWAAAHGAHAGHTSAKWSLFVALIIFTIAIYGGYFGAGMGVLVLAGLSFAGLDNLHQRNALKVLLNCIVNAITIVVFIILPLLNHSASIHWPLALGMALAATLGGFLGMKLARSLNPAKLRLIILAIGILLSAIYFYKGYLSA